MLTSKQRSKIKAFANDLKPLVIIGKGGVSDTLVKQASDALDKYEVIKVKVLENSEITARDMINDIATVLRAEPVQALGSIMILYRRSYRKDITHIDID